MKQIVIAIVVSLFLSNTKLFSQFEIKPTEVNFGSKNVVAGDFVVYKDSMKLANRKLIIGNPYPASVQYRNEKLQLNGSVFMPMGSNIWFNNNVDKGERLRIHFSSGLGAYFDFYQNLYFRTGNSGSSNWPLTLTSTSCIGIRKTNPTCALDIVGDTKIKGNLDITNGKVSVDAIVLTSDERMKEDIKDMSGSLASIGKLRSVSYKLKPKARKKIEVPMVRLSSTYEALSDTGSFKPDIEPEPDPDLYNRNRVGFLAQEVQKVFPSIIYEDNDGNLGIDYISLIPVTIQALQEQQKMINTQSEQINALKKEVELLKKQKGKQ